MEKLILQMQLALTVLAAALPLTPARNRTLIAHGLETIASTLRVGELAAGAAEELADRLAALHVQTASMADVGEADLEAAFERVKAASASFRTAFAQS